MGQKKAKGSVSIMNAEGRIRLRWRFQKKRYSINLFSYSKANLLQAKKIALQIETDLINGQFDATTKKYLPKVNQEAEHVSKTLVEHFEEWVRNYRNMDCEKDIDYNSTRNMMRKWGDFDMKTVVGHFNRETFGAKTYNRRLTLLKAFFQWAEKAGFVTKNPLEDVLPKKARKTEKPNRKPFTIEEISLVLEAFKEDRFTSSFSCVKHSYYYPFVYFIFKTGVRNAEAIGLRVQHVDLGKGVIHIKEALARTLKGTNAAARVRKETKNGKQRMLPLMEDLKEVLLPLLHGKKPDDLVFTSPKGNAIDDNQFQKRIFSKVLKGLGIEHRNLYACRHTFGSRCIHEGLTPVMTAFLMGNNPETALRNYVHLIELPNLPSIVGRKGNP